MNATSDYIRKTEVAAMLQVRTRTIEKWMSLGMIPYFKIGRSVRFLKSDIHKRLEEVNRVGA